VELEVVAPAFTYAVASLFDPSLKHPIKDKRRSHQVLILSIHIFESSKQGRNKSQVITVVVSNWSKLHGLEMIEPS
jgi:hypothetical protein